MKHKLYSVLIGLLLLGFFSCGKENNNSDAGLMEDPFEEEKKQAISFPKNIIELSSEAQEITDVWSLYVAMESEIIRMKEYNIQDAMTNSFTILQATDTLQKTIPKRFRQTPIQSRVNVLHAKANVLYQLSEKQIPDVDKIKKTAEEIPVDFYNLNIQLNEVFLETPNFEEM